VPSNVGGFNSDGELGDGTTTNSSTPVDVVGLSSGVAGVSAGSYDSCGVTTGGAVKCWGNDSFGRLGNSTFTDSVTPIAVIGFP
jgi:alpha-tubulin suppressor-like RCC1 family protein